MPEQDDLAELIRAPVQGEEVFEEDVVRVWHEDERRLANWPALLDRRGNDAAQLLHGSALHGGRGRAHHLDVADRVRERDAKEE